MIYEINISREAESDLRGIYEYIAFSLLSPDNAAAQLSRIEKCISNLNEMPERFQLYEKEPWTSRRLRMAPVDNFNILYIPDKETLTVTIIRIMYNRMDMDTHLEI